MIRPRLALAMGIGILAAACGGESGSSGSVLDIVEATSERDVVDGVAMVSSTVTVRFNGKVEEPTGRVPLESHFEFSVPSTEDDERVFVKTATISANSRTVTLTVDRIIPDRATLKVQRRLFGGKSGPDIEARVDGDLSPSLALLASTALAVSRPELFDPSRTAPLVEADRDTAAMRKALDVHLLARGAPASVTSAALARFDALPVESIPSPKIRAALAALTGTFAEPAINYLVTAQNCTGQPVLRVAFEPPPEAPELLARATLTRNGRRIISLNPVTEGDRIELLMPLLAHEAIHCDNKDGRFEEVAATAFDTFLYLQLVTAFPDLVEAGTQLGRDLNLDAVSMINSGRRFPESIGVLRSAGVAQAIPGSTSRALSFSDLVAASYEGLETNESPDEDLALLYAAILAQAAGIEDGSPFNLLYLDELLARSVDPQSIVAAIVAFQLVPAS